MEKETSEDSAVSGWVSSLVLFLVIILLAAIAIPNFVKARHTASRNACVNELRLLDGAKEQWALENKKKPGDVPTEADIVGPNLYLRQEPACPQGGKYAWGAIGEKPSCSLSNMPGHSLP